MKPVKTLITEEEITKLASRSNFRLGKAIFKDGKFQVEKSNPYVEEVKLSYKNGEAVSVRVESTSKGLRWKCSCNSRKDLFCQHCIALGLYIIEK
jgi:hypothetical protein